MSITHNALLSAAYVAMAATTSSCGPSSSASNGAVSSAIQTAAVKPAMPNACDVLDETIAKKYLGNAAHLTRKAQPNPHESQCQYQSANGSITIMVGPWDMVHFAAMQNKSTTGLGDEAWSGGGGLDVRKGDRGVNINVIVQSGEFWGKAADNVEAQMLAAETKVAPDLLAKL